MVQRFIELPEGYKMRMSILHAVDRPLSQLTVEDLCAKVGISRQTFYNYFSSKNDMPLWYSSFCDEITLREIGRTLTWRDGLTGYFELLKREQRFFGYTLDKMERNRGDRLRAAGRVERHFRETVEKRMGQGALNEEMEFCIKACADMLVTQVSGWFDSDMKLEPKVMARYVENCVPYGLHRALELRQ